jgi:hypothetical protein
MISYSLTLFGPGFLEVNFTGEGEADRIHPHKFCKLNIIIIFFAFLVRILKIIHHR